MPTPRWRTRWNVAILAVAAAVALVAFGIPLARTRRNQRGPGSRAVAPLPPASAGVISADYIGSRWRLTAVTDRHGTTKIPASVDAWLQLSADGQLTAFDDINTITGHFAATGSGFDVSETATTLVGYGGNDPAQLAAMIGLAAVTMGPHERPLPVTVLSADRERLNVQAGGVRLEFVRRGSTGRENPPFGARSA